jgi:hypothetical protein
MRRWQSNALGIAVVLFVIGGVGAWYYFHSDPDIAPPPQSDTTDIAVQVENFCGKCHVNPPADSFPRVAWKEEVERGYLFFGRSNLSLIPPRVDDVLRYYEQRAPEVLPEANIKRATTPLPVQFAPHPLADPPGASPPAVSHLNLVHLSDPQRHDILACEMRHGLIMALAPSEPESAWRILGKVNNPAHAEVADLDDDGIADILVADLGSFPPTDRLNGRVVWLHGNKDGGYTPLTLLEDVGRVADVEVADFNGDGKRDLVVAVFGWQESGEIIVLENLTTDWDLPKFKTHVVDTRRGGIHVPVVDLNGDNRPDFVALISQESETICAFINQGDFTFQPQTLYNAPHPAYGASGIQLVDLDGDSHVDVLFSNGDTLDQPHLLKPYHGIHWLRNKGDGTLEFEHRPIGSMYGAHRAVAGDLTGSGRLDIVAVSYLPPEHFPQRDERNLDAIVVFEQTTPGEFIRHTLTSKSCDHVTCVVGDVFGRGKNDIVTANFQMNDDAATLLVLENLGRTADK